MRARSAAEMRARIELQRVAGDDLEPARIARGDLLQRGDRALVALDGDHARARPRASSARVSPPGPGPTSITVDAVERPGGARDAAGEIEIEQEILAERFLGGQAVPADHLAQRRQVVDLRHATCAGASAGAGRPPAAPPASARRSGSTDRPAGAGDVEGGAVIGRGAHERQAERDVDARDRRPAS